MHSDILIRIIAPDSVNIPVLNMGLTLDKLAFSFHCNPVPFPVTASCSIMPHFQGENFHKNLELHPGKSLNYCMAKLIGSPPCLGTQDGLTIYRLEGEQYYVRMQSSITGKRIKKDKAFAGFRDSSSRLRIASRIASAVYRQFVVKEYPLYREMTGKAILWLKEGCSIPVVEARLQQAYLSKCAVNEAEGRSYHASEVKQPYRKVVVKGLFHIPDAFKTGVNRTRRRGMVYNKNSYYDKDNRGIHLVMIDFINKSHRHAYQ